MPKAIHAIWLFCTVSPVMLVMYICCLGVTLEMMCSNSVCANRDLSADIPYFLTKEKLDTVAIVAAGHGPVELLLGHSFDFMSSHDDDLRRVTSNCDTARNDERDSSYEIDQGGDILADDNGDGAISAPKKSRCTIDRPVPRRKRRKGNILIECVDAEYNVRLPAIRMFVKENHIIKVGRNCVNYEQRHKQSFEAIINALEIDLAGVTPDQRYDIVCNFFLKIEQSFAKIEEDSSCLAEVIGLVQQPQKDTVQDWIGKLRALFSYAEEVQKYFAPA